MHDGLAFDSLVSVTATETPDLAGIVVVAGVGPGNALRIARVPNVLYIPALRLQVVNNRWVPAEANSAWALSFETGRDFSGRAEPYRSVFASADSDDEVCVLANFYSRNFFHWVTEELAKVLLLEQNGFEGRYVLAGLPDFAFEFLRLMGIPSTRLVARLDTPTVFRSSVFVTPLSGGNVLQFPDVFHALRRTLLGEEPSSAAVQPARIWLDRDEGVNNKGRELLNPEEVYPLLDEYGVTRIDMARLPVLQQLAVARNANVMLGPHGAGFAHTFFMKPRSTVIECYSPRFINPGILQICRLLQHRYFMVVHSNAYGAYEYSDGIKVDCDHLELVLRSAETPTAN